MTADLPPGDPAIHTLTATDTLPATRPATDTLPATGPATDTLPATRPATDALPAADNPPTTDARTVRGLPEGASR
ncbi:hypothetical protein OG271_19520 [Micromonospora rifamycinica]|uniref:hypothetical protein n=1 Tax=Micromonospora rifamycinica TaxID=291594 RepID=UPI002E2BBCA6|nr:hypothetical protein [Micromonospora rifamycinica]